MFCFDNFAEVFETEDYITCNMFLEKGWILILVTQNVTDDFNIPHSCPVYVLGRPRNITHDKIEL